MRVGIIVAGWMGGHGLPESVAAYLSYFRLMLSIRV